MTGTGGKPLKSALDLAMERLAQREGQVARLTEAQKGAIAEVDRKTRAKIAELEILGGGRPAKAPENPEEAETLRSAQRAEIEKVRRRAEDEKERIRRGAAG
jgi:hypothetical protein